MTDMFKNRYSAIRTIKKVTFQIRLLNRLHCGTFLCKSVIFTYDAAGCPKTLYLAAFLNELLSLWSV